MSSNRKQLHIPVRSSHSASTHNGSGHGSNVYRSGRGIASNTHPAFSTSVRSISKGWPDQQQTDTDNTSTRSQFPQYHKNRRGPPPGYAMRRMSRPATAIASVPGGASTGRTPNLYNHGQTRVGPTSSARTCSNSPPGHTSYQRANSAVDGTRYQSRYQKQPVERSNRRFPPY
jgi:hypothetical protein